MPVPPPSPVAPYDTWEMVLQAARGRLNDMIQSSAGDILTDTAPFTLPLVINAWRKFQTFLTQIGHSRFKQRTVLFGFPPFAATDPSSQTALSWTYYFDGVSFWAPPNVPVLPSDFILPLKIWERQSAVLASSTGFQGIWSSTTTYIAGQSVSYQNSIWIAIQGGTNHVPGIGSAYWSQQVTTYPFPHEPMEQALDGLRNKLYPTSGWNHEWEWREDAIYMPGSAWTMDLQIEYAAFLADPATVNGVPWYSTATPPATNQLVPIMRALSPLSYYLAAEVTDSRDDADSFSAKAEDETKQLFNVEAKQKQRTTTSRKRFSSTIRPGGMYAGRY